MARTEAQLAVVGALGAGLRLTLVGAGTADAAVATLKVDHAPELPEDAQLSAAQLAAIGPVSGVIRLHGQPSTRIGTMLKLTVLKLLRNSSGSGHQKVSASASTTMR